MRRLRVDASEPAMRSGVYPVCRTAAWTRSSVSTETSSGVFSARETVTFVTPTSVARSLSVTRPEFLRARREALRSTGASRVVGGLLTTLITQAQKKLLAIMAKPYYHASYVTGYMNR